ncbi:DUF6526 family protein [Paenibacillus sp. NPDC056579]|uniref:DUF6526 family protein n=1 Tax=unclassified Paenibacillus TaxID=185978 RepID=UPI001EF83753|nr:DUF6526 family protein [Paenibacillus sp. H1-7]ULL18631.1 hypothetical protein DVH26_31660 [Paenibacillus sp. H1-7]
MQEQNYGNHKRLHPLFHFIGFPLALITWIASIVYFIMTISWVSFFAVIAATSLIITFFLTRLYATKLQDRIIRNEENFRHYMLTGDTLDPRLTASQVVALRFAGDAEFPALCKKAAKENLQPADIKKAIKQWRADEHRV